jgi:signal peptidase I
MSPSSENGDAPAVIADGHDGLSSGLPVPGPAGSGPAGSGRPARDMAAYHPAAIRTPQERDYRLRGLATEPTGHVPPAPARMDHPRRRRGPLLAKVAVLLAVAAIAALALQAFVVKPYAVPGNSMAPTLQAGDRILVVKPGPLAGTIHSGQIVVLHPPKFLPCTLVGGRSGDLVLRVVALPGQTIWSVAGTIFVNGRPLQERGWYNPRFGQVGSAPVPSTTLGRKQYFVLADNRSDTCDSRVFGPVSKSSIAGKGLAIVVRDGHFYLRKL